MFRSSSALASAYGIAVTTTMVVDGLLGFIVIWKLWNWKWWQAALLILPFVLIDGTFFVRQSAQAVRRGLGAASVRRLMVLLIVTWRRGTHILAQQDAQDRSSARYAAAQPREEAAAFVPGTAVFLTSDPAFGADRADAQSQAQQDLARAERHPDDRRPPIRRGCRRKIASAITPVSPHFLGDAEFRLHGIAERAEGAGDRAQAGLELRHHVDVVLPVAARAQAGRAIPACRAGRITCSSGWPRARATPPTSSRFRPAAWSRSARR